MATGQRSLRKDHEESSFGLSEIPASSGAQRQAPVGWRWTSGDEETSPLHLHVRRLSLTAGLGSKVLEVC